MNNTLAGERSQAASRTSDLAVAALIASLMAASAWITLPLGAVPVTLQLFFVVLSSLLLPPAAAAASMGVYLAMGAMGLPVFSGVQGGLGVLAGPTGGYLIGFLVGATAGAIVRRALAGRLRTSVVDALAALTVVVAVYAVGASQLAVVANLTASQALVAGVVPFIAVDAAKAVVAVAAAAGIRKARIA